MFRKDVLCGSLGSIGTVCGWLEGCCLRKVQVVAVCGCLEGSLLAEVHWLLIRKFRKVAVCWCNLCESGFNDRYPENKGSFVRIQKKYSKQNHSNYSGPVSDPTTKPSKKKTDLAGLQQDFFLRQSLFGSWTGKIIPDSNPTTPNSRVADPPHFDADPDPAPLQSNGNLRPLVYRPSMAPVWASRPFIDLFWASKACEFRL